MLKKLSQSLATSLPEQWQHKGLLMRALYPLAWIYGTVVAIREKVFEKKIANQQAPQETPFPILVVGNPTVGGVGKTPVVIWLADKAMRMGYRPAIITRGYKGKSSYWPLEIKDNTDVTMCGDEALMMFLRLNNGSRKCPVIAGPKRIQSIKFLENNYDIDLVISDDGLQHYAMPRDLELLVVDAKRQLGNGWFIPAGPLRESVQTFKKRLAKGAFLIENHASQNKVIHTDSDSPLHRFTMTYAGSMVERVNRRNNKLRLKKINKAIKVNAVAAIGNPQRFFDYLTALGFQCIQTRAFPDHHQYTQEDLIFDNNALVLMTEKDAVKCKSIASNNCWYMPITAVFDSHFEDAIERIYSDLVSQVRVPPQLLPEPAVQPKQ